MTQRGMRNLLSPLSRRFQMRQAHMKYRHLNTDVYSDIFFSQTKSAHGYTCGQLFVTNQEFSDVYPMSTKADAS
jgi:hypothetical protein